MEVNLIGKLVTLNKIEKPDLFADCITYVVTIPSCFIPHRLTCEQARGLR